MKPPMARLDRLLANLGYGSRKEVQALARTGAIVFDGQAIKDTGYKVPISAELPQRLTIGGAPVDPPAPLTLLMHKPLGVVCSHREPGRSVYELLPRRWRVDRMEAEARRPREKGRLASASIWSSLARMTSRSTE